MPIVEIRTKPSALWEHVLRELPASLVGYRERSGYGSLFLVYRSGEQPTWLERAFMLMGGEPVAEIGITTVKVLDPGYASTFEDIARSFEKQVPSAGPITIEVWEG